jgi:hypothetical protein
VDLHLSLTWSPRVLEAAIQLQIKWLKSIIIVRVSNEVMRLVIYYAPAALKGWGLNLVRKR